MKVVLIGSVPRSLVNFRGPLLQAMVERGHEVIACAPGSDESVQNQLSDWGVTYYNIPIKRTSLNPFEDIVTLWHLQRLFCKVRPDLVLSYTIKPVIWGSLAARITRVPHRFVMITGLGYIFMEGKRWRQRVLKNLACRLYRVALKSADGIFFQNSDDESEFHKYQLLGNDTRTILINGSGVDLAQFPPQPLPVRPIFLLMARLIADKGIREYHEAAHRVRQRYPQARFLLAGALDSNPSSISEAELAEWQAEEDVEYLGNLDDVRPALFEASVYVLPSYREGKPRTVMEAMAVGRPIITTDSPGCRETVEDGANGFLVPPRNVDALTKAMERLIEKTDLRNQMGAESRRMAREKYDVHQVNHVILEAMGL